MNKTKGFTALLCAAAMLFAFASCKNDSDDDDSTPASSSSTSTATNTSTNGSTGNGSASTGSTTTANTTTVYVYDDGKGDVSTVTLYANNTFVCHEYESFEDSGVNVVLDLDMISGTYTGNSASDGTIKLTTLKSSESDDEIATAIKNAVNAGKTSITITNADLPLQSVSTPQTVTGTIVSGTLVVGGTAYTKQ